MAIVDDSFAPEVSVSSPYFDGDAYIIASVGVEISLRPPMPISRRGWMVSVEQAFDPDQIPNLIACLNTAREIAESS